MHLWGWGGANTQQRGDVDTPMCLNPKTQHQTGDVDTPMGLNPKTQQQTGDVDTAMDRLLAGDPTVDIGGIGPCLYGEDERHQRLLDRKWRRCFPKP